MSEQTAAEDLAGRLHRMATQVDQLQGRLEYEVDRRTSAELALASAEREVARLQREIRKWEEPDAWGARLAAAREQWEASHGRSLAAASVYITALLHALGHRVDA